jgi:hypothetical protein
MTREQKIALLHELVEHAVAHQGLRADLHELIREVPYEQVPVRILKEAS